MAQITSQDLVNIANDPNIGQVVLKMLADHKETSQLQQLLKEKQQRHELELKQRQEKEDLEMKERMITRRKQEIEEKRQAAVYAWLDEHGFASLGCVSCGTVWKDMYDIGYGRVVCCPARYDTCYEAARQKLADAGNPPFQLPKTRKPHLYGGCGCIIYSAYYRDEYRL